MKGNVFILASFFCMLFVGCKEGSEQNAQKGELVSFAGERFNLSDSFFSQVSLVPLETMEQSPIRYIDAVTMSGDTLFLLDKRLSKVFIYLTDGKLVNIIQDVGNGSKEGCDLSDITVHNGSLAVLCNAPSKIRYYTYNGELVKEQALTRNWDSFASLEQGFCLYERREKGEQEINIFDEQSGAERILPQPNGNPVVRERQEKGDGIRYGTGRYLTNSSEVFFTEPLDYTLYTIKDGMPHPCYTIDFGLMGLPNELIEEGIGNDNFMDMCTDKKFVYAMRDVVANEDYLIFRTNPWMFLLDRKERKLMNCGVINTGLGVMSINYLPVTGTDKLVQIYYPLQLKPVAYGKLPKTKLGEEVARIYKDIKEGGNPVLMIYQLPKKQV